MLVLVCQLWFFRANKGTPGAGDNLISTAIAIEIGKVFGQLKKEGEGLKHTRLIIASWDGEEAGLRGSRAYCEKKKKHLTKTPTYTLNMDCLYFLDELFFLSTDVNGTVKLSKNMAKDCKKIANELGYKAQIKPIEFLTGGTDAGEFGRIGVETTSLVAMPWGNSERASVYHTPKDAVESIEPEVVSASMEIIYDYIQQKDQEILEKIEEVRVRHR